MATLIALVVAVLEGFKLTKKTDEDTFNRYNTINNKVLFLMMPEGVKDE